MDSVISPQAAMVYAMVVASAADGKLKDSETRTIDSIVKYQPIFQGYSQQKIASYQRQCEELLDDEEGLAAILGLIKQGLPSKLTETAYTFACEVIASDGEIEFAELEWLDLIRKTLNINLLVSAAIEYTVRARFRHL